MVIKKDDVITAVSKETGVSHRKTEQIINSMMDFVIRELAAQNEVHLGGFGIFKPKERSERVGRNPRTGESVSISKKVIPVFQMGKQMRDEAVVEL